MEIASTVSASILVRLRRVGKETTFGRKRLILEITASAILSHALLAEKRTWDIHGTFMGHSTPWRWSRP
jgi:hypothetical protein